MTTTFAVIEDGQTHDVEASLANGEIRIAPDALESALGWTLKPEGLCRAEVCVPTAGHATLVDEQGVDLEVFAQRVGLPLAIDREEEVASIGRSSVDQASVMASGEAPDFSLPDLDGKLHTLSEHRGKKVLLIAYASW
jgi:hypothetical protein